MKRRPGGGGVPGARLRRPQRPLDWPFAPRDRSAPAPALRASAARWACWATRRSCHW